MKPEYANTFGIRKVSDKEGEVLEVTLDISYKYMENAVTFTSKGMENVSTPAADQVASIAGLDFRTALVISTVSAWVVWLLFFAAAAAAIRRCRKT